MGTGGRTRMTTGTARMTIDARMMTLTQWLSPGFPTGAFAYSHGVETAIADGWITDGAGLEDWLRDCLDEGTGRSDAIWLRLAFAADDPLEIDAMARSYAISRERLREGVRQGAAFAATVRAVWGFDLPDLVLPVALGRAARLAGLEVAAAVALYLQAMVANLTHAAIRLMPLGQTEGQRVILALQPDCLRIARDTRGAVAGDVCGNAFLSDIAAMRHETLETRLFQS